MTEVFRLNNDFDINETFREKIRTEKNEEFNNIDLLKLERIENQRLQIDWIINVADGIYNVYIEHHIFSINEDELVKIIRFSPHLYYSKENNFFFNINFIRMFFYEKDSEEKDVLFAYVNKANDILKIKINFNSITDFFNYTSKIDFISLKESDFEMIKIKTLSGTTVKYIKKRMFEKEFKDLYTHYRFSLISVVSAMLFYFIPFIPFIGVSKYSIAIFPITTVLIISLLITHFSTKNKIKNLK